MSMYMYVYICLYVHFLKRVRKKRGAEQKEAEKVIEIEKEREK